MKESTTYDKGTLYHLKLDDLQNDPNQPRKYLDPKALRDLVDSIKDKGVLQPILFRVDEDGTLFIVAGERRLEAAKEAGLKTIPAILVEGNHDEIALIENILREDLTAIEFAEALERIQKEHDYTQEQLIPIIGKAKSTVSEILSLNKLPDAVKKECRKDKEISRNVLIEIAKKKTIKGMLTAYEKIKAKRTLKRKPRGKSTFQTRVTTKFDKMKTFLTDMKLEKIDPAGRKELVALIQDLKKAADLFLEDIKNTPYVKPTVEGKTKKGAPKKKTAKTPVKKRS
jgi:ParB family chromosome partitioning protein